MENINLQKFLWSDHDFENMGWHDCKVYATAFFDKDFQLGFDIDYILEWIDIDKSNPSYRFLITPATLIFRNVYDIEMNLDIADFMIEEVSRSNPMRPKNLTQTKEYVEYEWKIEAINGIVTFKSVGYDQYGRRKPMLAESQFLSLNKRGGISFGKEYISDSHK